MPSTLGCIGAGNMASAIIGGLITSHYPLDLIYVSDPSAEKLTALKKQYAIHISTDNKKVVEHANVLVFALKPQVLPQVAKELANAIQGYQPLVISIAAGITVTLLADWIGENIAIIRCMPNIPALVQQGMSGLYANKHVSLQQREQAHTILQTVGETLWVNDEDELNKITAISGSGPAYFFYFIEALQAAAEKIGLAPPVAQQLSLQTALGAATLAKHSQLTLAQLRKNVTSPGGTTEKALQCLEQKAVKKIIEQAVDAALERARELAK